MTETRVYDDDNNALVIRLSISSNMRTFQSNHLFIVSPIPFKNSTYKQMLSKQLTVA